MLTATLLGLVGSSFYLAYQLHRSEVLMRQLERAVEAVERDQRRMHRDHYQLALVVDCYRDYAHARFGAIATRLKSLDRSYVPLLNKHLDN